MNSVFVNTVDMEIPVWSRSLCNYAQKVLNEINQNNWELSILLCGDKTITELNAKYRNKHEPTDVLSFALGETLDEQKNIFLPGDIVISLDTLRENAKYFQISEDEELRRLLIHGILHLDGMDHKTLEKSEPMLVLQENILKKLDNESIIEI